MVLKPDQRRFGFAAIVVVAVQMLVSNAQAQCGLTIRQDLAPPSIGTQITATAVFDDGVDSTVFVARYQHGTVGIVRRDYAGVWRDCAYDTGTVRTTAQVLYIDSDPTLGRVLLAAANNQVLRWVAADQKWVLHAPAALNLNISALVRHTDGAGSRLVIASRPAGAGAIYELGASGWTRLGMTTLVAAQALVSFDDDGTGPNGAVLYAGGTPGASNTDMMKWDGTSWLAMPRLSGWVKSLAVFDDGGGTALYASSHPGTTLRYSAIAKWDGQAWIAIDDRPQNPLFANGPAHAMSVFNDGSGHGDELYALTPTMLTRLRDGVFSSLMNSSSQVGSINYSQMVMGAGTLGGTPVLWSPALGTARPVVGCPRCPGDFDLSGATSVSDVLDFLNVWFARGAAADFNQSGGAPSVQDLLDFLNAWIAGCA